MGLHHLRGTCATRASRAVETIGKPCAGKPHARFDRGSCQPNFAVEERNQVSTNENKELSGKRAAVIERELVARGIPKSEIIAIGMGSSVRW